MQDRNPQIRIDIRNGSFRVERDSLGGASLACYRHVTDYLGSVRTVYRMGTSWVLTPVQHITYMPSGAVLANSDGDVQQRMFCGKELQPLHGWKMYDSHARMQYNVLPRFSSTDPLCQKYYHLSPYAYCANDPVNSIDINGCDTLNISFFQNKWVFETPIIAKGNDVFNVTIEGTTKTYKFLEGHWGERVDALNLEITNSYTLGIYHVSGADSNGTGYYVTPGGSPSSQINSKKRIPEGLYPIVSPTAGAQWQQPGVGGDVAKRGVRFHYGAPDPRNWTEGCFVLSSDYSIRNNTIHYNMIESQNAVQAFDHLLGGSTFYLYKTRTGKNRYGSSFHYGINKTLILKSR